MRLTSTLRSAAAALLLAIVVLAIPAPLAAAVSARDKADIARVEVYLNDLKSLRSKFVQIDAKGALAEGVFLLQRPGRLRFEYAPPTPIVVVGDGKWLFFYDSEIDQVSQIGIERTPLRVLLAARVRFDGRVTVQRVERTPGVLRLVVLDREKPDDGSVTLVFSDAPLRLRQWLVTDAQGLVTSVFLSQLEVNPSLDPKLFVFVDPNPFRDQEFR